MYVLYIRIISNLFIYFYTNIFYIICYIIYVLYHMLINHNRNYIFNVKNHSSMEKIIIDIFYYNYSS